MRSATLLLTASAITTALFGLGLLAVPTVLGSLYGLHIADDAVIIARLLAGQLLGFAVLDAALRSARGDTLRRVLVAGLVAEVVGALTVAGAAATGSGNALLWSVAGLFAAFAMWRVLVLRERSV